MLINETDVFMKLVAKLKYLWASFCLISVVSCEMSVDTPANVRDFRTNVEALWKIMDEHYCYFTYKHINWDSVRVVYETRFSKMDTVNNLTTFKLCADMLNELKDGHVNLTSPFDVARYWKWYLDYPDNFSSTILFSDKYLGKNYRIAGGFDYAVLPKSKIGYVYYGDFSEGFTSSNLSWMLAWVSNCDGLIFDVRNNGGGTLTYAENIAARFTSQSMIYGYICHKTGAGHDDFSSPVAQTLEPYCQTSVIDNWISKPVVILTNRSCFSATNAFVSIMKQLPHVVIIGDQTGGGGGLPMNSELPNGWLVRYSACPMFNANMQQIEFGIAPTVKVDMSSADMNKGIDTIIETAIAYINQHKITK
jgi:hypothetical protein